MSHQLEASIRAMFDIASGKKWQDEMRKQPIRKSLCDDLFTLAANSFILGPSNEAEEYLISEIQEMIKRMSATMGYSSTGAFLTGLREQGKET